MRPAKRSANLCLTSSGSEDEAITDQRRIALLLVLFTFCPPGPLLRTYVN